MQHSHPHTHAYTRAHTVPTLSRAQKARAHILEEHLIFLTFDISQVFRLEHMKFRMGKKNTSEEMSLLKNASSIPLLSIVELHFLGAAALLHASKSLFFPPSEDSDRTYVFLVA